MGRRSGSEAAPGQSRKWYLEPLSPEHHAEPPAQMPEADRPVAVILPRLQAPPLGVRTDAQRKRKSKGGVSYLVCLCTSYLCVFTTDTRHSLNSLKSCWEHSKHEGQRLPECRGRNPVGRTVPGPCAHTPCRAWLYASSFLLCLVMFWASVCGQVLCPRYSDCLALLSGFSSGFSPVTLSPSLDSAQGLPGFTCSLRIHHLPDLEIICQTKPG